MQNRKTSNFINRYSSPGGGGGIPLKMLITLKILSALKSAKICQISISFVHIATLGQQQITLNERSILCAIAYCHWQRLNKNIIRFEALGNETSQHSM